MFALIQKWGGMIDLKALNFQELVSFRIYPVEIDVPSDKKEYKWIILDIVKKRKKKFALLNIMIIKQNTNK